MFKKILLVALALAFVAADAMAGTVTLTQVKRTTWGNKRIVMGLVTLTGAYSTTAFAFTPRTVGLNQIERAVFYPSGSAGMAYSPYLNSTTAPTYLYLHTQYANSYKPAVSPTFAGDTLRVRRKAFVASDADTSVVYVTTLGGSSNAFLGIIAASIAGTTAATATDPFFYMADSATAVPVFGDSAMTYPTVRLRGILQHADTVYFDYNGTNRCSRLYYTGTGLGNMGDLYIPINSPSYPGRFLKIAKTTGSGIATMSANPLHFIHASTTMDEKLIIDGAGTQNITCGAMVDTTYTSMPLYSDPLTSVQTGRVISASYGFIIVGN